ncbi:Uncharacterized protein OBRU01_07316 [Operophtera brumata]|uniref:F-box/LRR-repeat protein 15-like leucin rich repeat domain-containing protein n=1 Tax=Operophtera brumata TaxID=104452 RepID=A0A0L7LJH0_OPEBR|nr:Uncharacterized protein OBRU01_07316 [Operophtera brumata]
MQSDFQNSVTDCDRVHNRNRHRQGLRMSTGSCSGPGICGGARRRPPPPPEPALSLAADLSELSLDQGYHTLAEGHQPRRRQHHRDATLNDALCQTYAEWRVSVGAGRGWSPGSHPGLKRGGGSGQQDLWRWQPGCPNVDWPEWAWLEPRLGARRPPVEYIDLTDCGNVTDAGLCALLHTCPSLQYLYLRRCILVTDAGVRWIPAYCALKELSVSDCVGVTDFGLYELAKIGQALRYLSVAKCTQVSDSGIRTLARRCYKLRYLNARGCGALGDDGVEAVAKGCSRLRALDLGATDVSEAGLQKLALRGCELIGDDGLEAVAYYCRGLCQLNIQDTPVTLRGYRAVKKYCKRCVIEHTNPGFC